MVETVRVRKAKGRKDAVDLVAPDLYINRELSNLAYFERVLAQAQEPRHPLLDRVFFLSIVAKGLDEFFMVRVSDLQDMVDAGMVEVSLDGMTPSQQLAAIRPRVMDLQGEMYRIYREHLLPQLREEGVCIMDLQDLSTSQRAGLRTYFERQVFPVLTPLAVDPGHPFPHISNQSVNLAVELRGDGSEARFARVKVPNVISRLVHLEPILGRFPNGKRNACHYVWLDQLIASNLTALFPGIPVLASYGFRVVRDADIEIHQEEGVDLRMSVERGLRQRRFGEPVLLVVQAGMPARLRSLLAAALNLGPDSVYAVDQPLGLSSLDELTSMDRPDLKYPPIVPRLPPAVPAGDPITGVLDHRDVLVHHPYESFAPIVDMLTSAARDPQTLAIKQTLYRVGTDAPVVRALLDAANKGKQVAVLVELKARFDEASNIEWARELERAGVHVVYGFVGLKTHAKVALVVRKDGEGIKRYVHIGTGNYNVQTARGYTDLGLFTAHPDFGVDASDLFNYLTGYSQQTNYRRFLVAPVNLRQGLLQRIDREIERHRADGNGRIIFKMNSLGDGEFIQALYRASEAGVTVDLIVRGISALRPGVPGVSDNIKVRSVIGRFLEHSRVYYFGNGGQPELYIGSADLLPRNLDHRVEVLAPVLEADLRDRVLHNVLETQLRDTVNAWEQDPDGTYRRVRPAGGEEPFDSQAWSLANDG